MDDDLPLKFLSVSFLVLVLIGVLAACGWIFHAVFWPVEQAGQIVERTLNADNVIYNYEWFHERLADYDTAVTALRAKRTSYDEFLRSAGVRAAWTLATQRENDQLRVELDGMTQHRAEIANEYNSHVGMANRNLFRSRSLPDHLDPSQE